MNPIEAYCPRISMNVQADVTLSSEKRLFRGVKCNYFFQFRCTHKRPCDGDTSCDLVTELSERVEKSNKPKAQIY